MTEPTNSTPLPAPSTELQEILAELRSINSNTQQILSILQDVTCNRRHFNVKDNGL